VPFALNMGEWAEREGITKVVRADGRMVMRTAFVFSAYHPCGCVQSDVAVCNDAYKYPNRSPSQPRRAQRVGGRGQGSVKGRTHSPFFASHCRLCKYFLWYQARAPVGRAWLDDLLSIVKADDLLGIGI